VFYGTALRQTLRATDVRVWAVAAMLIVAIAALGTLVPAIRASRVDPAGVLRVE